MVKPAAPAKLISASPLSNFDMPGDQRLPAEYEPMPPPPANKSLGRETGKDGRPTVTDLSKAREGEILRETEASLLREMAEER